MEPVDVGKYEFIRMPLKEKWGILVRVVIAVINIGRIRVFPVATNAVRFSTP